MERVLSSAPCVRVTLFHSPGDFYVIRTEDGGKLERIQRWADIDVSNDRYGPEPHHRLQVPLRQTPLPSDQGDDEDALPGNPEAEEEALGLDDGLIFMDKKVFFCGYCGNKFRHGGALFQHELHAHEMKIQ